MRPSLIATTLWAWSHYASASASTHTFPLVQRDIPAVIGMNLHSLQSLKPHLKARDSATVEGQMADVPDSVSSRLATTSSSKNLIFCR